jgi:hypothetical protein
MNEHPIPSTFVAYEAPEPPLGIVSPFPGVSMTAKTDQLFAALARAQGRMRHVEKTRAGYENRYQYANLSDVLELLLPVLAPEGLSLLQLPHSPTGDVLTLTSMLCHESGQWVATRATMPIPVLKGSSPMQSLGAVSSFLRRYLAQAQTGQAAADEDTDAHSDAAQAPAPAEQINALAARIKDVGADPRKVLDFYHVRDLHEMTADMVADCHASLDRKAAAAHATKAQADKLVAEAEAAKARKAAKEAQP